MDLLTDFNLPLLTGILFTGLCALVFFLFSFDAKNLSASSPASATKTKKKKEIFACPFSKESSFVQESNEHLPPTPLDLHHSWKDNLATRWLAEGLSGQDVPGMLRAGLKKLRNSQFFLVQEPYRIAFELGLKKKNLDDFEKHKKLFVMEDDSVDAQRETLELFLAYLPDRYPDLYTYDAASHSITVHPIDTTFAIDDWKDRPLELCERIVQEDLVLMRSGPPLGDDKKAKEGYYMAAAAVVFSFGELREKLGKPAEFIHAPVPGFEEHLRRTVNMMFTNLKPEQPLWRNNWGIAPTGSLDEPLYGSESAHEKRNMTGEVTLEDVKAKFLKVEYQTIRRLLRTGYLLFTVKTMVDPLTSLEAVTPKAATCLAASIRGMSSAMRAYKGLPNAATTEAVLSYLDVIIANKEN